MWRIGDAAHAKVVRRGSQEGHYFHTPYARVMQNEEQVGRPALSANGKPMREGLRFEGLTLTVNNVEKSVAYYRDKVRLDVAFVSLPAFALLKAGTGTIGLLSSDEALKAGAAPTTPEQRRGIHIEFSTDDLDALYATLLEEGLEFVEPPHDQPWERSMTALDPDGHSVEFAQGRRGSALAPK